MQCSADRSRLRLRHENDGCLFFGGSEHHDPPRAGNYHLLRRLATRSRIAQRPARLGSSSLSTSPKSIRPLQGLPPREVHDAHQTGCFK